MSRMIPAAQELSLLQLDAIHDGNHLAADACARIKVALYYTGCPRYDDIDIVQRYIGSRTQQDRYGR